MAIQDIPRGLSGDDLTQTINDRLRSLQQAIPTTVTAAAPVVETIRLLSPTPAAPATVTASGPVMNQRSTQVSDVLRVSDALLEVDTSKNPIIISLKPAIQYANYNEVSRFIAKSTADNNLVTIVAASGENINGNTTASLLAQYESAELLPQMGGWLMIGGIGSSTVAVASQPGNVSIASVDVIDGTPDASGNPTKRVTVTYNPPTVFNGFTGVEAYLDAPDSAMVGISVADGTVPADGTTPAGIFNPTDEGWYPYTGHDPRNQTISPSVGKRPISGPVNQTNQVVFTAPAPTTPQYWRVYLASGNGVAINPLVQAGDLSAVATPSFQFFVSAPATNSTGREFAPNVVNQGLTQFSLLPAGWTTNPNIVVADSGDQYFEYSVTWNWPTNDQNYASLGGVNLVLSNGLTQTYIGNAIVGGAGGGTAAAPIYISPHLPVQIGTTNYVLYLISYDVNGNSNSLYAGITPAIPFNITRNTGTAGSEFCANVTAVTVTANPAVNSADGTALLDVVATFTKPPDQQWGGAEIVIQKPNGTFYSMGAGALSPLEEFTSQPNTVQTWKFFVRSIDINGRRNTIVSGTTPEVDLSVGSALGQLNLGKAVNTSFSTQFSIVAGALTINGLNANIITTGVLKVGNNGSGNPVELEVFDHLGSLIGWIGDDTANSGFVGGWLKQFRCGGSSPLNAPLQCDPSGNFSLAIPSGTININIDATNFVKVSDTVTNRSFVQLTSNNVFVQSTLNSAQSEMAVGGFAVANSLGAVTVQLFGSGNGQLNLNNGTGTAAIFMNGFQCLTTQQPGPGNPVFTTFANVQNWCLSLLTGLRSHGLIT